MGKTPDDTDGIPPIPADAETSSKAPRTIDESVQRILDESESSDNALVRLYRKELREKRAKGETTAIRPAGPAGSRVVKDKVDKLMVPPPPVPADADKNAPIERIGSGTLRGTHTSVLFPAGTPDGLEDGIEPADPPETMGTDEQWKGLNTDGTSSSPIIEVDSSETEYPTPPVHDVRGYDDFVRGSNPGIDESEIPNEFALEEATSVTPTDQQVALIKEASGADPLPKKPSTEYGGIGTAHERRAARHSDRVPAASKLPSSPSVRITEGADSLPDVLPLTGQDSDPATLSGPSVVEITAELPPEGARLGSRPSFDIEATDPEAALSDEDVTPLYTRMRSVDYQPEKSVGYERTFKALMEKGLIAKIRLKGGDHSCYVDSEVGRDEEFCDLMRLIETGLVDTSIEQLETFAMKEAKTNRDGVRTSAVYRRSVEYALTRNLLAGCGKHAYELMHQYNDVPFDIGSPDMSREAAVGFLKALVRGANPKCESEALSEAWFEEAFFIFEEFKAYKTNFITIEKSAITVQAVFNECLKRNPSMAVKLFEFFKDKSWVNLEEMKHYQSRLDESMSRCLTDGEPVALEMMDKMYEGPYLVEKFGQYIKDIFHESLKNGSLNALSLFERFGHILQLQEVEGFEEALHDGVRQHCSLDEATADSVIKFDTLLATPNGVDLFEDEHTAQFIIMLCLHRWDIDGKKLYEHFPIELSRTSKYTRKKKNTREIVMGLPDEEPDEDTDEAEVEAVEEPSDSEEVVETAPEPQAPEVVSETPGSQDIAHDETVLSEPAIVMSFSPESVSAFEEHLRLDQNTDIETARLAEEVWKEDLIKNLENGSFQEALQAEKQLKKYTMDEFLKSFEVREAAKEGYFRNLIVGDFKQAKKLRNRYATRGDLYYEVVRRAYRYCKENGLEGGAKRILKVFRREINAA